METKECIENLRQTVIAQNEKFQELEAKVMVMKKYIEKVEKLEQGYDQVNDMKGRIQDIVVTKTKSTIEDYT